MWKILIVNCITDSCIWNTGVTWQGTDYRLSEDDTIGSKHVGVVISCEIIVHLLVIVKNDKRCTVNVLKKRMCYVLLKLDNTKYMVMCRDQNAGRSHSMKTDNSSFERVEEFKYLGTTLTNQNSIQEEIKSRLK